MMILEMFVGNFIVGTLVFVYCVAAGLMSRRARLSNNLFWIMFVPILNILYAMVLSMRILFPIFTTKNEVSLHRKFYESNKKQTTQQNLDDIKSAFALKEEIYYHNPFWEFVRETQKGIEFKFKREISFKKALNKMRMHPVEIIMEEEKHEEQNVALFRIPSKNWLFAKKTNYRIGELAEQLVAIMEQNKEDEALKIIEIQYKQTIQTVRDSVKDALFIGGEIDEENLLSIKTVLQSFSDEVNSRNEKIIEATEIERKERQKIVNEAITERLMVEKEYIEKLKQQKLS